MKKILLPVLALGIITPCIQAEIISPEEALARVSSASTSQVRKAAARTSAATLLETVTTDDGQAGVYVFTSPKGYLITPADDSFPALLGYGDKALTDDMPPALRYWIDEYARQIEWARSSSPIFKARAAAQEKAPIEPLVATEWNQGAPYNDLCPMDSTSRSVTGCVATAMAQIMKYHNWPAKGTGSNSYKSSTLGISITADYSQSTYDWTEMLDTYTSDATEAQKNAVARLMYDCGTSVDMNYSSTESGASSFYVASALSTYFSYDKGVRYLSRDYYSEEDWEDIVYEQLASVGPVQYSGQSATGGHSFVCDGYSSDGYFHINWGWGGMSNGYFLLSALDPVSQGIGGSSSGYNFTQDIIADIRPAQADSKVYQQVVLENNFLISTSTVTLGGNATVIGPVYNLSIEPISCTLGLKTVDSVGTVSYLAGRVLTDCSPMSGLTQYSVTIPSTLSDGKYTVSPAFMDSEGEWHDILVKVSAIHDATMTVADGAATFVHGGQASILIKDIDVTTTIYAGENFRIEATATNTSDYEYYGTIMAALVNSSNMIVAMGDELSVDLGAGESQSLVYESAFGSTASSATRRASSTAPAAGDYKLYFVRVQDNAIVTASSPVDVTVQEAPATTTITVSDMTVEGNVNAVDKSGFKISFDVTCTEGYFADALTVAIFPYTGGTVQAVAQYSTPTIYLESGQSQTVTVDASLPDGTDGAQYMAAIYDGSRQITGTSASIIFRLDQTTGAADDGLGERSIEYDGQTLTLAGARQGDILELYSIDGIRQGRTTENAIDMSDRITAVYIARATLTDGSVITRRFAK